MTNEEFEAQELEESAAEYLAQDRIAQNISYVSFVSYSKGKNKLRRKCKEIELVSSGNGYHLSKNFRWDEISTELMPMIATIDGLYAEELLRELVPINCVPKNFKRGIGVR